MPAMFRLLISILLATFTLSGCYNKPVRHLASDAALIQVGISGQEDVLTYLGEPDEQIVLESGVEKWVYTEYERSALKTAPVVGKYFGPLSSGTVIVVLKDDVVTECKYGAQLQDSSWTNDFDWQKTPQ